MSRLTNAPLVVLGAGGHAKVVISTLQALGLTILAALDDNPARWGSEILGVPVQGPMDQVLGMSGAAGIIAIGDNAVRSQLAKRFDRIDWKTAIHPRAYVHPSVQLGRGTIVFAGAVVQPDTVIGEHTIINTGASIDHDCRLGDFTHIAPGAHLAGTVRVGNGVLLGVGSSVIPGRSVGEWTVVGAGGVVVHDLPDHITAMGVPARPQE